MAVRYEAGILIPCSYSIFGVEFLDVGIKYNGKDCYYFDVYKQTDDGRTYLYGEITKGVENKLSYELLSEIKERVKSKVIYLVDLMKGF